MAQMLAPISSAFGGGMSRRRIPVSTMSDLIQGAERA
jgi:hypothetical protein